MKKGIERLYRYIHPTCAVITVATRCYGQSAGASLKSFRGCCGAAALIPLVFIGSPVAAVRRLNPTDRNARELLMTPIVEREKRAERDYGAAGCGYQWITTVWLCGTGSTWYNAERIRACITLHELRWWTLSLVVELCLEIISFTRLIRITTIAFPYGFDFDSIQKIIQSNLWISSKLWRDHVEKM